MYDYKTISNQYVQDVQVPLLVRFGILLAIIGLSFPIYGIPLLGYKLTIFRIGNAILLVAMFCYCRRLILQGRFVKQFICFAGAFLLWRLISLLLLAQDKTYGVRQWMWFFEGYIFIFTCLVLCQNFEKLKLYIIKSVFYIGLASILTIATSFILYVKGYVWTLPLSTSMYGVDMEYQVRYGYPISAGRILGPFQDPNMTGTMCAFFIIFFVPLLVGKTFFRSNRLWLLIATILTGLTAAVGTGSRQAAVAIFVVLLLQTFLLFKYVRNIALATKFTKMIPFILMGAFLFILLGTSFLKSELDITSTRIEKSYQEHDLTGGRIEFTEEALSYLDFNTFIFGMGEGMTLVTFDIAPHNGFLIVLLENGIIGIILLIIITVYLAHGSYKKLLEMRGDSVAASIAIACLGVSLAWMFFIFVNWAQLNGSVSYLYLISVLVLLDRSNFITAVRHTN